MFELCDCGSGKPYLNCCGRLHAGAPAGSAEELMRSRYTAYTRGNMPYLLKSWAPETRPVVLDLDPDQTWTGLEIRRHETTDPDTAVVEFTAHFRQGKKTGTLTETSRFRRDGNSWVYVDGDVS